jgi:hypothetical protein
MLIGLEGSSPTSAGVNNYKYYVWQAYQETVQRPILYKEGPSALSTGWHSINIKTMSDAATIFINGNSGKVCLIGWSRGAAACIQVAHNLNRSSDGKKIDAMFLFDAVDQDTSTSSDLNFIPNSVVNVYHAVATNKSWLDRRIFPTCGLTHGSTVNFVRRDFNVSHGEIAGTAGKGADGGSRDWMWNFMSREGVI